MGVFVISIALRLLYIWELQRSPFRAVLMGDAAIYDAWAQRIASGDWIGTGVFYQAPLYPYFLGVLYSLFGRDLMLVRVCQALLGAFACALITVAGGRLFSVRAGLAAGLVLAIYAPAIYFDGLLQKTVLDLFFLSWLLLLVAVLTDRLTRANCFWAGVALGFLGLSRENALALLPVLLAWLWLRGRRSFAPVVALSIGVAIVLAPVAIRNLAVGGEFYVTTSQLGPNLYIGNHEGATGSYVALRSGHGFAAYEQQDATRLAEESLARKLSPAEVSRFWQQRALDWILGHPAAWLRLMVKKILLVWNAVEISDTEDLYSHADGALSLHLSADIVQFGVLAPLGFLGILLTRSRWRELWVFYAICAVYSLSVALFYVFDRYRYPLVPVLVLFAGAGLAGFPAWWRRVSARERWRAGTVVGVVVVMCNWPLVSKESQRAATHYNLGYAFQAEGKTEEAIGQYREALALEPEFASAHTNLCVALGAIGEHAEALQHCQEAMRIEPGNAEGHNNLGMELAAAGRHDEAIASFREAIQLDPRLATAHANLGTAFAAAGDSQAAIRHLAEAIRLEPKNVAAHNNLGILLASGGRLDEAIEHFETALRLRPDNREAEANLARARALRGR